METIHIRIVSLRWIVNVRLENGKCHLIYFKRIYMNFHLAKLQTALKLLEWKKKYIIIIKQQRIEISGKKNMDCVVKAARLKAAGCVCQMQYNFSTKTKSIIVDYFLLYN